jgi:hypothetical protein
LDNETVGSKLLTLVDYGGKVTDGLCSVCRLEKTGFLHVLHLDRLCISCISWFDYADKSYVTAVFGRGNYLDEILWARVDDPRFPDLLPREICLLNSVLALGKHRLAVLQEHRFPPINEGAAQGENMMVSSIFAELNPGSMGFLACLKEEPAATLLTVHEGTLLEGKRAIGGTGHLRTRLLTEKSFLCSQCSLERPSGMLAPSCFPASVCFDCTSQTHMCVCGVIFGAQQLAFSQWDRRGIWGSPIAHGDCVFTCACGSRYDKVSFKQGGMGHWGDRLSPNFKCWQCPGDGETIVIDD